MISTETEDKVVVEYKDSSGKSKIIVFKIKDFGNMDVDVEELMVVHLHNIVADMATFPEVLNRISNIKVACDDLVAHVELDNKIFYAQKWEEHKKKLVAAGDKATDTSTENAIIRDPQYIIKQKDLLKVKKQAAMMNEMLWSAKSKDKKLEAISAKIKPEDFSLEIMEGSINNVMIKLGKNHFPDGRR